jgi:hypothetical protein
MPRQSPQAERVCRGIPDQETVIPCPSPSASTAARDVLVWRAIAMRINRGLLARRRHHVDVRVVRSVVRGARADFEHLRVAVGAVLQTVAVTIARLKPGRIARAQDFLAAICHEYHLARQHVHELVLLGVPVALARPRSRLQPQQVDAELGEPGRVAQSPPVLLAAWLVEWRGVESSGDGRDCGSIDSLLHDIHYLYAARGVRHED